MDTKVDIYDPDLYVDGPIHQIFSELRRAAWIRLNCQEKTVEPHGA